MISVFAMGSPIVRRSRRRRASITSSEESLPAIIGGAFRVSSALSALDRRRFLLTYQQKMCFINCSGSCGHVQAAQIHLVAGRCEIRTHHAVQINESRGGSGVSVLRSKSETQQISLILPCDQGKRGVTADEGVSLFFYLKSKSETGESLISQRGRLCVSRMSRFYCALRVYVRAGAHACDGRLENKRDIRDKWVCRDLKSQVREGKWVSRFLFSEVSETRRPLCLFGCGLGEKYQFRAHKFGHEPGTSRVSLLGARKRDIPCPACITRRLLCAPAEPSVTVARQRSVSTEQRSRRCTARA